MVYTLVPLSNPYLWQPLQGCYFFFSILTLPILIIYQMGVHFKGLFRPKTHERTSKNLQLLAMFWSATFWKPSSLQQCLFSHFRFPYSTPFFTALLICWINLSGIKQRHSTSGLLLKLHLYCTPTCWRHTSIITVFPYMG